MLGSRQPSGPATQSRVIGQMVPRCTTAGQRLDRAQSDLLPHSPASVPSSSFLSKLPPFAKSSKSLLSIPVPHFLWPGSLAHACAMQNLRIKFWSGSEDVQAANPRVQTLLAKAAGITAGGLWSYWCAGRKFSMKSPSITT